MAEISMSGRLPAGDQNGLGAIISDLVRDPQKMHVAIAILDARKVVRDADTGEVVPVVRIRRIEVIPGDDQDVAKRLMVRALDRRSGREQLPYDLETELDEVFGGKSAEEYEREENGGGEPDG